MKDVTAEQVEQAVKATGYASIRVRDCSICGAPLGYSFQSAIPHWNGACDCGSYYSEPQPRSWQSIADSINMQNAEWKPKMAALYGITPTDPA